MDDRSHDAFRCRDCGYDLSSTIVGGRCPECGLEVIRAARLLEGPDTSRLAVTAFALANASVFLFCVPLGPIALAVGILAVVRARDVRYSASSRTLAAAAVGMGVLSSTVLLFFLVFMLLN